MFLFSKKKIIIETLSKASCSAVLAVFVLVTLFFVQVQPVMATGDCVATGGTVTEVGSYCINTFTSSGTFVLPSGSITADVLVVGGGGGGGGGVGGGGGAGGYRYISSFSVSHQSYSVAVGSGGVGGVANTSAATNGGDSIFSTITATGGGAGGDAMGAAQNGGNGGGGFWEYLSGANGNTPSVSPSQGNNGGNGISGAGYSGGGGGGSSSVGGNAAASSAGSGGNGTANSISGISVTYSGGGGGAADASRGATAGTGGNGGGGNGGFNTFGSNGTSNTGGGGGGGSNGVVSGNFNGGSGGSGIVIIRYLKAVTSIVVSGASSVTSVIIGNNLQMSAAILPSADASEAVAWSVTNGTGSATINSSTGLLTATGTGTVTVTASATDGSGVTGTEQITVTPPPSTADNITSFGFGLTGETDTIGSGTVSITVPYGTNLTNLTATFSSSQNSTVTIGSTSQISGTTLNNFTNPVTYTVTAQDGQTTQQYVVTVTVGPAPTCPTISNAATYNAYPTCGVATCSSGYILSNGSCVVAGGGGINPAVFILPSIPTGGFQILINNGASSTNSQNVILAFNAGSDVKRMAISNTADFYGSGQQDYTPTIQWTLSSGNGTKTVYAKFYTQYGQSTQPVSASIILGNSYNSTTPRSTNIFTQRLKYGSDNNQVLLLQKLLKKLGFFPQSVLPNGYFGLSTLKAVESFQVKYDIANLGKVGYGQVGPNTRKKLNILSAQ